MVRTSTVSGRSPLRGRVAMATAAALAAMVLSSGPAVAVERVDVNKATLEQLTELPGIGDAKAAAIVEERSRLPFANVGDLERVKGIGPGLIADLRDRVTVAKPKSR